MTYQPIKFMVEYVTTEEFARMWFQRQDTTLRVAVPIKFLKRGEVVRARDGHDLAISKELAAGRPEALAVASLFDSIRAERDYWKAEAESLREAAESVESDSD